MDEGGILGGFREDRRSLGEGSAAEVRYKEICDAVEDGIVLYDGRTGRIVDVNRGACLLYGYDRAGLLSLPPAALSAVEEGYTAERAAPFAKQALETGRARFEWRSRRADGSCFWSDVRLARSGSRDAPNLVAVVRDIDELKSTRESSRLAEDRYRSLVENLPNSTVMVFDHELRFVLIDGPELAANGFSKQLMEGRTIHETLPAEFAAIAEPNIRRVLRGEAFFDNVPFGDVMYASNYIPLRDESGRVTYGMVLAINVTVQHEAEQSLRRSEERFAKIFHASPDAMGVTRSSDNVIIEVNQGFRDMFGWSREQAIGRTAMELEIWSKPEAREATLRTLESPEGPDFVEHEARRKDGSVVSGLLALRSIELDGRPCRLFVFRDTSEQLRALRALEASEARLRGLAEATFEGIAVTERGKIVDVNDQLAVMFGMRREEMIGKDVSIMVAPESHPVVQERMGRGIEEPYEHLSVRKDGTRFPVEVRPRAASAAGRQLRVSAIRDVTERKKAEAERERLIAELTARNAEMEQFTYTVSHDLKSPLVTISGFLGMLERDLAAGDMARVRGDAARIGSAAGKMMRLLSDLLELSRVGRVTRAKRTVLLSDIVREALELVSFTLSERRVRVHVEPELPLVFGDPVRLVQVVQNLVENAVKYMGQQPEPEIEIGTRPDPEGVVCFVRDNGVGVDPKYKDRIFGLFEKLDPRSQGTGVGLALVRRIVEFHGGSIWVESDGVHGSTFVLRLPKAEDASRQHDTSSDETPLPEAAR